MPFADAKTLLRKRLRAERDSFYQALDAAARARCHAVPASPLAALLQPGRIVSGYVAMGSEADPMALLAAADARGCTTALPHVTGRAAPMRFLCWSPGDPLEPGPFGLMQPRADAPVVRPDIVLVPLVGFDRMGTRLGQGAGHYDRALSLLPDALRIGIAWAMQEVDAVPADPWDEPLHAILTEKEWIVR